MEGVEAYRAIRAAREVAHAASHLAAEAAALARIYEERGAQESSITASQASIRAARAAFKLDEDYLKGGRDGSLAPAVDDALRSSLASLDAAAAAIAATREALDLALASNGRSNGSAGARVGEG